MFVFIFKICPKFVIQNTGKRNGVWEYIYISCFNYLNVRGSHDNPPDSCCNPLKSVIKSNPECLCSMISIKATNAAQQYGINLTDISASQLESMGKIVHEDLERRRH
ncbi:Lipid transfer-like protein VAS [Camellia lanceoleosa]|uniref:Lipid transfer-like protein VAS n=1 Tax=Camellia lanceoleosa TaxID=1840588 RepID=A0ACC0H9P0_9ERIC|nr:Lipid transfer-like protein VAS [Camellia lanceoleosa]